MRTLHKSFECSLLVLAFLFLTDYGWTQQGTGYYVHNISTGDIIVSRSARPHTGIKKGDDLSALLGPNDWLVTVDDSVFYGGQGKKGEPEKLLGVLNKEFTLTQDEYRNATGDQRERLGKRLGIYKSFTRG